MGWGWPHGDGDEGRDGDGDGDVVGRLMRHYRELLGMAMTMEMVMVLEDSYG